MLFIKTRMIELIKKTEEEITTHIRKELLALKLFNESLEYLHRIYCYKKLQETADDENQKKYIEIKIDHYVFEIRNLFEKYSKQRDLFFIWKMLL